jgi:hypothetical protein
MFGRRTSTRNRGLSDPTAARVHGSSRPPLTRRHRHAPSGGHSGQGLSIAGDHFDAEHPCVGLRVKRNPRWRGAGGDGFPPREPEQSRLTTVSRLDPDCDPASFSVFARPRKDLRDVDVGQPPLGALPRPRFIPERHAVRRLDPLPAGVAGINAICMHRPTLAQNSIAWHLHREVNRDFFERTCTWLLPDDQLAQPLVMSEAAGMCGVRVMEPTA